MTRHRLILAAFTAFSTLSYSAAAQQQPAPAPAPAPASAAAVAKDGPTLVRVQVLVSRRQGEKKIGTHPYTLTVAVGGARASLRMGVQVPIPNYGPEGKTSIQYKDVGTSIECSATPLDAGRFKLDMSLVDNFVMGDDGDPSGNSKAGIPSFGSFSVAGETLILRDGQTAQLTTATDKRSGEVVTVDVTLTVIK